MSATEKQLPETLAERIKHEADYHDHYNLELQEQNLTWDLNEITQESLFEPSRQFMFERLGDVRGKKILDIGCGFGFDALVLLSRGAKVTALDVSPVRVESVKALALKYHLADNLSTAVAPAEKLPFPDEEFDVVFGDAVLHHTSLPHSIPEINRVLKSRGIAVFREGLHNRNFVIRLWRRLTPIDRTVDERPLTSDALRLIGSLSGNISCEPFYFVLPLVPLVLLKFLPAHGHIRSAFQKLTSLTWRAECAFVPRKRTNKLIGWAKEAIVQWQKP